MDQQQIRILNVVGRMDRGGIETLIMNVYRNIDRDKVQFDFLAHYGKPDADYNEEIKSLGGRIFEMPVIKTTEKTYYWKFFEYKRALKEFFNTHPEYHVIHGHMTNTASIYMPIAQKYGSAVCCIAHSHLTQSRQGLTGIVTSLLRKPIRKCATDYFTCSVDAGKWLYQEEDFKSGKVQMIKNGIKSSDYRFSPEKREMIRAELGLGDALVFGHVGRFFSQKNHGFLMDIFSEIHKRNPNTALLCAGEGVLMPEIKEKATHLGLADCVHFLGLRTDVSELMQAMDIFLMPSLFEGLPVVGIEAQAAGLPMYTSTAVTQELNITGNVRFLDLAAGAAAWADKILADYKGFTRTDTHELIVSSGYDIKSTADFLQDFYLRKHAGK